MLQSVETPQSGWEQLVLDIFSLKSTHYLPPVHCLMAKQNVLYRLSRIVPPKPWKEGKIYT